MPANPIRKLRKIALVLPKAHEGEAWGAPTFLLTNAKNNGRAALGVIGSD
jgi:hypothetical protein